MKLQLTKVVRYDGMIHGFFGLAGGVDKAKEALTEAAEGLKAAFDSRALGFVLTP